MLGRRTAILILLLTGVTFGGLRPAASDEVSVGVDAYFMQMEANESQCIAATYMYVTSSFFSPEDIIGQPDIDGNVRVVERRATVNGSHPEIVAKLHPDFGLPYRRRELPAVARLMGDRCWLTLDFQIGEGERLTAWTDSSIVRMTSERKKDGSRLQGIQLEGARQFPVEAFRPDSKLRECMAILGKSHQKGVHEVAGDYHVVRGSDGERSLVFTIQRSIGMLRSFALFDGDVLREQAYFSEYAHAGAGFYPGAVKIVRYLESGDVASVIEFEKVGFELSNHEDCDKAFAASLPLGAQTERLSGVITQFAPRKRSKVDPDQSTPQ